MPRHLNNRTSPIWVVYSYTHSNVNAPYSVSSRNSPGRFSRFAVFRQKVLKSVEKLKKMGAMNFEEKVLSIAFVSLALLWLQDWMLD